MDRGECHASMLRFQKLLNVTLILENCRNSRSQAECLKAICLNALHGLKQNVRSVEATAVAHKKWENAWAQLYRWCRS